MTSGQEAEMVYFYNLEVVVVVVVEYLYSASRSASNALIVPQRCEEMSL